MDTRRRSTPIGMAGNVIERSEPSTDGDARSESYRFDEK
jgi:hypothetical protein